MNRIGIFLDRDGTINQEIDFLRSPNELQLIPGSADAIREANGRGWKVFIITNQSGIARGFLTEDRLKEIHAALEVELGKHEAHLDAIFYCPHHPDIGNAPYRKDCECRKPNVGMLLEASERFGIDLSRSFVIGDRMIDVQTGINSGATPILVLTGYGKEELEFCRRNDVPIGHVADDLRGAMTIVKNIVQQKQPSIC